MTPTKAYQVPISTSDRAPCTRLAWAGVAVSNGGFGPSGTGGSAAWLGFGAQRPNRHVACNIIVGPCRFSFFGGN